MFKQLSSSKLLVHFLVRSYSLELLFILSDYKELEGIENLYLKIISPKPKYASYLTYLHFLKDKVCIKILDGATKKVLKLYYLEPPEWPYQ